jgi:hypothetical protein
VRWYTLPGWPARVLGHSAATPVPAHPAPGSAYQYKDGVTGWPGTKAIPAPVAVAPSPDWGDIAQMGVSRSSDAPSANYPNLYYVRPERDYWPGAGMPVSYRSDNLMPVPATDPRSVAAPLQTPVILRGNQQIAQPAPLIQWPHYGGPV